MHQTILNFEEKNLYIEEDYIISSINQEAYHLIVNSEHNWGIPPYANSVLLSAPTKSGKTYLVNLLLKQGVAFSLSPNNLLSNDLLKKYQIVIVDNIEKFSQNELFHIFNICHEHQVKLLLTASTGISESNITLPDLLSRLRSIRQITISPPDQEMISAILIKYFSQRSIKISNDILAYMIARVPRNFNEIFKIVDQIDQISLAGKRNVTIPLIKSLLSEYNVTLS